MANVGINRTLISVSALVLVALPSLGQRTTGSTGSGGRTLSSGTNSPYNTSASTSGDGSMANRPMFISGKVIFDDGSPTNPDIRIVRTCGSSSRLQIHTDSKGHFYFQLDSTSAVEDDASDSGAGPLARQTNTQSNASKSSSGTSLSSAYWNCDIRATYPGYRSDIVSLSMRRTLDDPDVGTIILHRLANVKGSTISLTSALAPKHAQKEYEKGLKSAQLGRLDEAADHFKEATDSYPKYAVAWFALGQAQQRENKWEDARRSYLAAVAADSRYVSPYDQLASVAAQHGKWEDAADMSSKAISLNPVEFPSAFWYNAIANYQLKKNADAEKSAKELVKLDSEHHFPEAESLLAQISLERREYPEAAAHIKAYLALAPNAKNAEAMKLALKQIEATSGAPQPQQ